MCPPSDATATKLGALRKFCAGAKVAMTPAERQRLYMQRLKDKAAANGKQPGHGKASLTKYAGWKRLAGQV